MAAERYNIKSYDSFNSLMFDDEKERAISLYHQQDYQQSLTIFQGLLLRITAPEERAGILIFQCRCQENLGLFVDARSSLEEARRVGKEGLDPDYEARLRYFEAGIDAREGKDKESLRKLDSLLQLNKELLATPELRDLYEGIQILRAGRLQNLDRPHEALPLFLEAQNYKAEKPDDFLCRTAYCLAKCGEIAPAKALISRVMQSSLDPAQENTARYYLAGIFVINGEYAKAFEELQFCERHLDQFELAIPALMQSLAYVCEKLGLSKQAFSYRRASAQ